jgi:hypothetical protein
VHGDGSSVLLDEMVVRYVDEIEGYFDSCVYVFVMRVLLFVFIVFLNGMMFSEVLFWVLELVCLFDRVVLSGAIEWFRVLECLGS